MERVVIDSPIGFLEIKGAKAGLVSVIFMDNEEAISAHIPEILVTTVTQLKEYFNKERSLFQLTLAPEGTQFQQKVWKELQEIPFGKTTSYQKMANALGDPKVIRAAASANGKNPISIIIPCHRVIGTDGSLTGYAGGLHRKKWLLAHESPVTQGELF
ncbi:MAG: methylated-DNA--[protein]-cysteine S-methyltransferase [Bacteroidetes bacterium]|nr:methylated-DNA--[protein]-cysteine S-methyltransferase [Bacteroidota bacterium]